MHDQTRMPQGQPIIELTVKNHPGVMVHVANLFARRAFNLEGILCGPLPGGRESRMLLLVGEDARLEQVVHQLEKLHDVLDVRPREDLGPETFATAIGNSA
jgi:acetolactate synthase I/III small subunit